MKQRKWFSRGFIGLVVLAFIISQVYSRRIDFTKDQRYTLTETSKSLIDSIQNPLQIQILLGGELTGSYRILRNEISFLLQEMRNRNPQIEFKFVNPLEDFDIQELEKIGLTPIPIQDESGILNIYPYAKLSYRGKEEKIIWMETLVQNPRIEFNQLPIASTERLEFLFMSEIQKLVNSQRKKVGVIVHHDELPEKNFRSFGAAISEKYDIEIVLDPIQDSSFHFKAKDLDKLKTYDALILAKPTLPFSDLDKLILDQYIMNGGKTLWMLETVDAEMDSIFRSDKILAFPRDLKLNDFMFSYGVRILPTIIKDLEGAKIILADGNTAGNTSYNFYTWPYFLRATSAEPHPINQGLSSVKMEFANPIEILDNPNITTTVLLSSSPKTNFKSPLTRIELSDVNIQNPEEFSAGMIPTAVLVEGNFQSAYANRFESKEFPNFKPNTVNGKMIVVSDGDIAKNHLWFGNTMALGEDKYSMRPDKQNQRPTTYDNQAFLLNSLDYLMGEEDFLFLRNRKLHIPLLSKTKVEEKKSYFQILNLSLPLILIGIIGFLMFLLRKKRFG